MIAHNSNAIDVGSLNAMAPPGYGEHRFDQLYLGVDTSGFQTPAGLVSGLATPIRSLSRTASAENLSSMGGDDRNTVIANTLRNRLDNLNTTEESRTIRDRTQLRSSSQSSLNDGPQQEEQLVVDARRRTSGQSLSPENDDVLPSGAQTPMHPLISHIEYTADDLARVPSYSTALRSRPNLPIDHALPNYETALSTPRSSSPFP